MLTKNEQEILYARTPAESKLVKLIEEKKKYEDERLDNPKWWDLMFQKYFEEHHGDEARDLLKDPKNVRDPEDVMRIGTTFGAGFPLTDEFRYGMLYNTFLRDFTDHSEKYPEYHALKKKKEKLYTITHQIQRQKDVIEAAGEVQAITNRMTTVQLGPEVKALVQFLSTVLRDEASIPKHQNRKRSREMVEDKRLPRVLLPRQSGGFVSVHVLNNLSSQFADASGRGFVFHFVQTPNKSEVGFTLSLKSTQLTIKDNFAGVLNPEGQLHLRQPALQQEIETYTKECSGDPVAFSQWISHQIRLCWVCLAPLTDETSIEKGMGPTCRRTTLELFSAKEA